MVLPEVTIGPVGTQDGEEPERGSDGQADDLDGSCLGVSIPLSDGQPVRFLDSTKVLETVSPCSSLCTALGVVLEQRCLLVSQLVDVVEGGVLDLLAGRGEVAEDLTGNISRTGRSDRRPRLQHRIPRSRGCCSMRQSAPHRSDDGCRQWP